MKAKNFVFIGKEAFDYENKPPKLVFLHFFNNQKSDASKNLTIFQLSTFKRV